MPQTISVVIPCYNYERYVGAAIESVLRSTRPADEIIVVDDGSTDGSAEVCARYSVTLISKANGGMSSALNAGISAATGDVVVLCDADDSMAPERLAWVSEAFGDPGVVMAWNRMRMIDTDGRELGTLPEDELPSGDLAARIARVGLTSFTVTSGIALRRAPWAQLGPIPEAEFGNFGEAFLIRSLPFYGQVAATQDRLSDYVIHTGADSRSVDTFDVEGLRSFLRRRVDQAHREHALIVENARRTGHSCDPQQLRAHDPALLRLELYLDLIDGRQRWSTWRRLATTLRHSTAMSHVDRASMRATTGLCSLLPRRAIARLAAAWYVTGARTGPAGLMLRVAGKARQIRSSVPELARRTAATG